MLLPNFEKTNYQWMSEKSPYPVLPSHWLLYPGAGLCLNTIIIIISQSHGSQSHGSNSWRPTCWRSMVDLVEVVVDASQAGLSISEHWPPLEETSLYHVPSVKHKAAREINRLCLVLADWLKLMQITITKFKSNCFVFSFKKKYVVPYLLFLINFICRLLSWYSCFRVLYCMYCCLLPSMTVPSSMCPSFATCTRCWQRWWDQDSFSIASSRPFSASLPDCWLFLWVWWRGCQGRGEI